MKKIGKPVFFIVLGFILFLTYTAVFGISDQYADLKNVYIKGASDIRLGIDMRGGVDVTFTPPAGTKATEQQMAAAEQVIKSRLVSQNITDSEVYTDYTNGRIIVRFPWKVDETEFNPEDAIKELGATAELTFREGKSVDYEGKPTGETSTNIILTGKDVSEATAAVNTESNEPIVSLKLTTEGAAKFAEATGRLVDKGYISIWMDETMVSSPYVEDVISNGQAMISGSFTAQEAKDLAAKINSGALPFKLETENFSSISPTLGIGAKDAMVLAGLIAFFVVCVFMISLYRMSGVVACVALLGQVVGSIAAISGYFPFIPSFTITLPGIAGVILSIGMGVDANVITAERIMEELSLGKTVDGAVENGFKKAFSAVLDGNVTVIIVAIILMGAFGPASSMFSKILSPVFFMFGASTAGAIYSFGYTLLVGVILNLIFGVLGSRLMMKSLIKFKRFRNPKLFSRRAK